MINQEKLKIVLKLYKEGNITVEQAATLLEEPAILEESIPPIQPLNPYIPPYPYGYPIISCNH